MSRIGKKPIDVPGGVKVEIAGRDVTVSGPKTKRPLTWSLPAKVSAAVDGSGKQVVVTRADDTKESRAQHGLSRSLIANMIQGAAQGYERRLLVFGTGYSCNLQGGKLLLNCGFMGRGTKEKPQFELPVPEGLEVTIETAAARGNADPASFVVRGADKQLVGDFCARVRSIRVPEPYKGKGIRYQGEQVQRKAGKAFAGGGAG
jgi:large subunit ribosomal protein L6